MIKKLSLSNFRGHTRVLEFGPGLNIIKGKNESGKSTIKEAFAFVMQGTDSSGTKNPDHLITVGEDVATVSLQTAKATITRRKKRGTTSATKLERDGIPAVSMSQTDMQNQIKLSHEVFMSCWNVGYFMELSQAQKMKVLGEIANLDRKELLRGILPENYAVPSWVTLLNPKIDANKAADLRRQSQNKRIADEATLAQMRAQLETYSGSATVDVSSYQQKINSLEAQYQAFSEYEKDVIKYNNTRQRNAETVSRYSSVSAGQAQKEESLSKLMEETSGVAERVALNSTRAQEIVAAGKALRANLKQLPSQAPAKPKISDNACPTCGSVMDVSHKQKLMAEYESAVLAFNKIERATADHNKPIEQDLDNYETEYREVQERLSSLQAMLYSKKEMVAKLQLEVEAGKKLLATYSAPVEPLAPTKPDGDQQAILKELTEMKSAVHSARMHAEQREKLSVQINNLEQSVVRHTSDIDALADLERALQALPELETAKTLEVITVHGVKLALLDGELVVTDEKGVDYRSLSDGRRMKIDLAFCGSIRRQAGPYAPGMIFLDNADLIDRLELPQGVQILVAKVDPNADEVVVIPQ